MSFEKNVQYLANNLIPLMLKVGALIFILELVVMFLIDLLGENLSPLVEALIDASVLSLSVTPITYILISRSGSGVQSGLGRPAPEFFLAERYGSRLAKLFLPPMGILVLLLGLILASYFQIERKDILEKLQLNEERLVLIEAENLSSQIQKVVADLDFFVQHMGQEAQGPGMESDFSRDAEHFLGSTRRFGGLRLLDNEGLERLRLEYNQKIYKLPPGAFPPKEFSTVKAQLDAGRPYLSAPSFRRFLSSPKGEQFLGVDLAQKLVGKDGQVLGWLVLEARLDRLLQNLLALHGQGQGQLFLLTEEGQVLYQGERSKLLAVAPGGDSPQSWSRKQWSQLTAAGDGWTEGPQGHFFVQSYSLNLNNEAKKALEPQGAGDFPKAERLLLVSFLSQEVVAGKSFLLLVKAGIVFVILLLSLGATLFMAVSVFLQREAQALELMKAKDKAEAATRAKSEFLANMSHEIRTPMNAILGFAEILKNRVKDDQNREYLAAIDVSGKALLSLINDILDLSKVEAGKFKLEPKAMSLAVVLEDLTHLFAQKLGEKGLLLNIQLDPTLPLALLLDEIRLRQILLNLVGNAIKFTEKGYITVEVKVQHQDANFADLLVLVKDTGAGIAKEHCETIFGAFEQRPGQSHALFGGTGLGLTICRRLVKLMGGRIWVESDLGKGCEFYFTLPQVKVLPQEQLPGIEASSEGELVLFEPAQLLVVDDIPSNRNLVRGYLEGQPITLIEAGDGLEALEKVRQFKPDLVLMDLKMPRMDGLEAVVEIKKLPGSKVIPVICFTASVMRATEEEIQVHFDGFLRKPMSKSELIAHLRRYLPCKSVEAPPETLRTLALDLKVDQTRKDRLVWLLQELEGESKVLWQKVNESSVINEVEDFAKQIKSLSLQGACPELENWAQELERAALLFELEKIPKILAQYPAWVSLIKKQVS